MELETGEKQGFDLNAAADELISNEAQEQAPSNDSDVESDKQTAPQENSTEEKEVSTEDILAKISEEKKEPQTANEDFLKFVNELGAVHNGQPVKIENVDQLKEFVQKGYDYTKKTMALSDEIKTFEKEKEAKEIEYKTKYEELVKVENDLAEVNYENQIMQAILQEMQINDPDLFEEFKTRYATEHNRRSQAMPYVKQFETKFDELNNKIQSLQGEKEKNELLNIKQSWEKELSAMQTKYAPMTNKLGVKFDWDKVQETWKSDASGKMSVEQAIHAVHGAEIAKAYESHQKLLATKNKTTNAMLKKSGIGSSATKSESEQKFKTGDYGKFLEAATKTME